MAIVGDQFRNIIHAGAVERDEPRRRIGSTTGHVDGNTTKGFHGALDRVRSSGRCVVGDRSRGPAIIGQRKRSPSGGSNDLLHFAPGRIALVFRRDATLDGDVEVATAITSDLRDGTRRVEERDSPRIVVAAGPCDLDRLDIVEGFERGFDLSGCGVVA